MGVRIIDLPEHEAWLLHLKTCAEHREDFRQYEAFDDMKTHEAGRPMFNAEQDGDEGRAAFFEHRFHQALENGRMLGFAAHYWWYPRAWA